MEAIVSPLLISMGQTAALLSYLRAESGSPLRDRKSGVLLAAFFLLHCVLQALQRAYAASYGLGSLPTLPFLLADWLLYALFLLALTRAGWPSCCFVAFVLILVDSCVWPLISSASRLLWGVNYLYEGAVWLRVPFILLLAVLECLLARLTHRMLPQLNKLQLNIYDGILALAIIIPFLYFRMLAGHELSQSNKSAQIVMTVCCLVAVLMLAAEVGRSSGEYEKLREAEMLGILRRQQAMFEQKLQDMDLINRKYHDMKNTLLYLQAQGGEAPVEELLGSISPYEQDVATGNEVIDVILSEKLAGCAEGQITCVPWLDGRAFDFVRPLDLCTLLGNAMDNAMESCRKIPEPDRRQIRVYSARKGSTVILTVRNTFSAPPVLRNGMPVSTKQDPQNHGYGLRNMQYVAEQYGGLVSCRLEGEEFVLSIVLENPANQPEK